MRRTYLIDSENINDVWVELLQVLEDGDEILVFYTDKSAHMGYDRIVCLMEQKRGAVHWIKCFEGQNALDFQLVTELGSCLSQNGSREYIIVSNDTGYDAVVRYWQQKGCSVRRIKGTDCEKGAPEERRQEETAEKAVSEKKGRNDKSEKVGAAARVHGEEPAAQKSCAEKNCGGEPILQESCAAGNHRKEQEKSESCAAGNRREEQEKSESCAVENHGEKPGKSVSSAKKVRRKKSPKVVSAENGCGETREAKACAEDICGEKAPKAVSAGTDEAEEIGSCRQTTSEENGRKKRKNRRKKSQKEKKEECRESVEEDTLVFTEEPELFEDDEAVLEQELFGDGEEDRENGEAETEEKQNGGDADWKEELLKIFRRTGSREPEEDRRFLLELCKTLKLSNMSLVHNVMEYHFGLATGNGIYRFIRENPGCRGALSAGYSNNKKERERRYLELILARSEMSLQEGDVEQILKILNGVPKKNLNGIHSALLRRFGQEDGGSFYAVLRNHVKIIREL